MNRRRIATLMLAGSVATILTACAGSEAQTPTAAPPAAVVQPTIAPLPTVAAQPNGMSMTDLALNVTGAGEIKTARDADLSFQVPGVVAKVMVQEGDQVKEGDVLAILDTRTFDLDVQRAEAALSAARAGKTSLTEGPRSADIAAADAQIRQAEAQLAQVLTGPKDQDVQSAQAALSTAQANLQSTRDRLSAAKTSAQLQIEQAANQLRNAQDSYSRVYWDNRNLEKELGKFGKELPQANKDQEAAAQRAVQIAETTVEQSRVAFEQAQQAEVTGIQAAEQQVTQSQAALEKLLLPADKDRVAAARAALEAAKAARSRLNPDPRASQQNQAAASIDQAQVALDVAKINRERAELRAPFDGLVSIVNIDPGDPSTVQGRPAMQVVDVSKLRVDVQISDADIAKVKNGQKADVRVDAIPEKVFTGTVTYIAPTATTVGTVRNYLVRITLDTQDGLRAGMSTRVEIKP